MPAGDAVLKINFPHEESAREPDALAHWAGDGAVRLLARDDARRALLIERARPGTPLWDEDDDAATQAASEVLARLHARPAPAADAAGEPREGVATPLFRALADEALRWARELPQRWEAHGRPCPAALIDRAVAALPELARTQPRAVVLHQDLHGGNVLRAARGPLAIDPKPLAGDPAFDAASLIRDRREWLLGHPHPQTVLERRIEILGGDVERTREWAIAHALAWGLEANQVHPAHLAVAQYLAG